MDTLFKQSGKVQNWRKRFLNNIEGTNIPGLLGIKKTTSRTPENRS